MIINLALSSFTSSLFREASDDADDTNDPDTIVDVRSEESDDDDELSNSIPMLMLASPESSSGRTVIVGDSLVVVVGSGEISMVGADGVSRADDSSRRSTSVLRFRLGGIHLLVTEL